MCLCSPQFLLCCPLYVLYIFIINDAFLRVPLTGLNLVDTLTTVRQVSAMCSGMCIIHRLHLYLLMLHRVINITI